MDSKLGGLRADLTVTVTLTLTVTVWKNRPLPSWESNPDLSSMPVWLLYLLRYLIMMQNVRRVIREGITYNYDVRW
jgi:hypothetical protein